MRYYFYCPNCGFEKIVTALPEGVVGNTRDGFGTPIYHFDCPKCHNRDAGYMRFSIGKMSELSDLEQKEYFQNVIIMYQNLRGIKD